MYNKAVADGTANATWKDDEWERTHPTESEFEEEDIQVDPGFKGKGKRKATASNKL